MKQSYILIFITLFFTNIAFTQSDYWKKSTEGNFAQKGVRQIIPQKYKTFQLDATALNKKLATAPLEFNKSGASIKISLPMPDGTIEQFSVVESPIMEPGLAAQFPTIKTYLGHGLDNPHATVRFDWTHKGFHAMILSDKSTVFIDPYSSQDKDNYIVYYKKDFHTSKQHHCLTEDKDKQELDIHVGTLLTNPSNTKSGNQLRTYRLALSCTGEYSQYHGGTVNSVMSAMTTSMNRVNGIYENEVAVRMILVANNSSLIYLNAGSDPFNNNSSNQIVNQNQTVIDNAIGSNNYDIGHVFSTGGGGFAPGSVCQNGDKARAVTGTNAPINDPFDVDYVAHEMGHQFSAGHTFNGSAGSCAFAIWNNDAYEPGSGTTIMGYAGICGNQNIQNNSSAYFHTKSFDEITTYTTTGQGATCDVVTTTGNTKPNVDAGTGGYTIPKSTPFELVGSATDPENHPLTYCWEQFDLGPQGAPNSPQGNAPIFRSFPPVNTPARTFPQISDIVNNTQTIGEILPDYARSLSFRLTARDNQPGGGGVSYDGMSINVTDQAGPFLVTEPNTNAVTWTEGAPAIVSWDVANTDQAPVNCGTVDILLSVDGGYTYPYTISSNIPNNGMANVLVPSGTATNQARVRVQCATSVFFDISNQNFTITAPTVPDYLFWGGTTSQTICAPDNANFAVNTVSLLNYTDGVNLTTSNAPDGLEISFSANPVTPGDSLFISVSNTGSLASGTYPITINGTSTSGDKDVIINLTVYAETPTVVTPILPVDGEQDAALSPKLIWDSSSAPHSYDVQLATDAAFTNIIVNETNLTQNELTVGALQTYTVYYWRVKANNDCTPGEYSETFTFRTATVDCTTHTGAQVRNIFTVLPLAYNSALSVSDDVSIVDINVKNLQGTHTRISDMSFRLISPSGTEVSLFSRICNNQDDFNINLDDDAPNDNYPCPPTDGGNYQPEEALANFSGENSLGTWVLIAEDHRAGAGGVLNNWELEICKAASSSNEDPVVVTNEPLLVDRGTVLDISNELLLSTDADNAANELTYTLLSETTEGELSLDGTVLTLGSTFKQTDIDAGSLKYTHTATAGNSDAFRFHVDDGQGGWTGSPTFTITILEDMNPFDLNDGEARIYPNPTSSLLNVSLRLAAAETVNVFVVNAIGQKVLETSIAGQEGTNPFTLDMTTLMGGVYFLVMESENVTITEKVMVVK